MDAEIDELLFYLHQDNTRFYPISSYLTIAVIGAYPILRPHTIPDSNYGYCVFVHPMGSIRFDVHGIISFNKHFNYDALPDAINYFLRKLP
jgi:hypothetical protein